MQYVKKMRLLAFIMIALLLTGCTKPIVESNSNQIEDENKIQIGMIFDSFVIERWQRDRDVFVSTAKELGAEVNVQNANGDIEEQKKLVEYFIKKDVDVIVIICIDADELKTEVQKAMDAGIKVIAYDRLIKNAKVDLYISFDNEAVGKMMGEALVEAGVSGGKVIMLGGSPKDNNVPVLEKGFTDVMEANNISVIDSMHCDGWRAELAGSYIYENTAVVDQADAVMCGNDNLASQAVHALAESRKAGNILVVGQDADLEACQRIVEGTQLMTVYKPVEKLAQKAAECAVLLAQGKELNSASIINDGTYDISYISLEPIGVTKENINEVIINSGFHLKEDVYLNVPYKMPQ